MRCGGDKMTDLLVSCTLAVGLVSCLLCIVWSGWKRRRQTHLRTPLRLKEAGVLCMDPRVAPDFPCFPWPLAFRYFCDGLSNVFVNRVTGGSESLGASGMLRQRTSRVLAVVEVLWVEVMRV